MRSVDSIRIHYSIDAIKGKGQPTNGCPFGEGISLIMGCSKKYNVLGVYAYYIITDPTVSVHK